MNTEQTSKNIFTYISDFIVVKKKVLLKVY